VLGLARMWATVIMGWCPLLTFPPESLQVSTRWKIESPGDLALFLGVGMDFEIWYIINNSTSLFDRWLLFGVEVEVGLALRYRNTSSLSLGVLTPACYEYKCITSWGWAVPSSGEAKYPASSLNLAMKLFFQGEMNKVSGWNNEQANWPNGEA
jgi:hypothetical protein